MKLKKGLVFAALFSAPVIAAAQNNENLVENGGFESITGKGPKKVGQIDMATGWKSPTGARADLFMSDTKIPEIGAPANVYGNEEPREGENYAGIMTFSFGDKLPRTYILGKLSAPLKKDMKYCVKFYASLADGSKYSANQLGVNLNKKEFGTDAKSSIIDETHILHPKNKMFTATYGWELVCGTYIAEGGEKFITIGNFTSNDNTKNERNKKNADWKGTPIVGSYFYIDDISVTLIGDGEMCDCGIDEQVQELSPTIYQRAFRVNDKASAKEKIEEQTTYFAAGKDRISEQGKAGLDIVAEQLKANGNMMITLIGHSGATEDEYSQKKPIYADMDKKRAAAVKEYLVSKGVDANRITIETKGHSAANKEIAESDDDDLKMAKSQRVEIRVK
jgi:OmpA-OmpF porin, OOP family